MKVKFVSDFHTEFWNYNKFQRTLEKYLPPTEEDKEIVLCCCGDMGIYEKYPSTYKPLMKYLGERFKLVLMVAGNHSWYHSSDWWGKEDQFWQDKKIPKNVRYLNDACVYLDDVKFIGSTLWTCFEAGNPLAIHYANRNMSDYEVIKRRQVMYSPYGESWKGIKLQAEDTLERNKVHVAFLERELQKDRDMKKVVITHHSPSAFTVSDKFKDSALMGAYVNRLERLIYEYKPVVWGYGHQHDSFDAVLDETRLINNSLGYHALTINKGFNPNLVVEL
jgi:hypothetical protein